MNAIQLTYTFLSSFIACTFLLQWWQEPSYPPLLWITLACVAIIAIIAGVLRKSVLFGAVACIAVGMLLSLWTVSRSAHVPDAESVEMFATGERVSVHGYVSDRPDIRSDSILYAFDVVRLTDAEGTEHEAKGTILVTDRDKWPRLSYGKEATIDGILEIPAEQWYAEYLSLQDIRAVLRSSALRPGETRHASPLFTALFGLRSAFERRIDTLYPEPAASLLAGLLTGTRRGMPEDLSEAFRRTGLSHILVISGTNVTIILAVIGNLLFFLPQKRRFLPGVLAIVLFAFCTGADASVVRASIMGILGLLAIRTGRLVHARLAILWTAFLMLLWNPLLLWHDAGFQLSFLAVIGLSELRPLLEKPLGNVPAVLGIKDALLATIAAQLTAVPWVVYRFGLLSILSPLANILVAPLVPLAMLFGFAGVVAGFAGDIPGRIAGFPGFGFLDLIIAIARVLGNLDMAAVELPGMALGIVLFYYAGLTGIVTVLRLRLRTPWPFVPFSARDSLRA